jgi:hypothetical protein
VAEAAGEHVRLRLPDGRTVVVQRMVLDMARARAK